MSRRKQRNPSRVLVNNYGSTDAAFESAGNIFSVVISSNEANSNNHTSAPTSPKQDCVSERRCHSHSMHAMFNASSNVATFNNLDNIDNSNETEALDLTIKEPIANNYPSFCDSESNHVDDGRVRKDFLPKMSMSADGFCHLCKKYFCNKYYLRKHRADVHDLYTDYAHNATTKQLHNHDELKCIGKNNASTHLQSIEHNLKSLQPTSLQTSSLCSNQLASIFPKSVDLSVLKCSDDVHTKINGVDTCADNEHNKDLSDMTPLAFKNIIKTMADDGTEVKACAVCGAKFDSHFATLNHLLAKHASEFPMFRQVQSLLNINFDTSNLVNNGNEKRANSNIALNGRQCAAAVNIPSKLSERVTCDICGKELCNKYFLRTHKTKVHNVQLEKSLDLKQSTANNMNTTTSTTFKHADADCEIERVNLSNLTQDQQLQLFNMGIDPETYCSMCRIAFDSKSTFKNHYYNMHQSKQTIQNKKDAKQNADICTTSRKSRNSSPTRCRVKCTVCAKELCDKYFLKCHMSNVHKMTIPEMDKSNNKNTTIISTTKPFALEAFEVNANNKYLQNKQINSPTQSNDSSNITGNVFSRTTGFKINENSGKRCNFSKLNESVKKMKHNDQSINEMQQLLLDSDDPVFKKHFNNCLIYLPIKSRVMEQIGLQIKLQPVKREENQMNNERNC